MILSRHLGPFGLLLLFGIPATSQQYVISTYAGGAPTPTPVAGTAASIGVPLAVATDAAGNVYLASDNCVFKLDTNGILTRVAGNARPGYSGDGGLAANAQLSTPLGVAVDGAGNLYIADSGNFRVRRVTPAGTISTVAGDGTFGYSGDGGPATSAQLYNAAAVAVDKAGNLFVAAYNDGRVRRVTPAGTISTVAGIGITGYSGDGGPATAAQISVPWGLATDSAGNLYIADYFNHRVRRVTPAGTISTVAGNGSEGYSGDGGPATTAQLNLPLRVAVDSLDNLYIADVRNARVRKVTPAGMISTVAGNGTLGYFGDGGTATGAQLGANFYAGVAVDSLGNLYISDNQRIRKVSPAGIISTVAGTGRGFYSGDGNPATSAQLNLPTAVAVDGLNNLYIADVSNQRVRKVSPAGMISTVAGDGGYGYSGDGGPATSAQLNYPYNVAADSTGNLYIADSGSRRVRKVTPAGIISTVAGNGGQGYSGDGGPAISAQLGPPAGVVVDSSGNLYVVDSNNESVRKVTPGGIISTVAGGRGIGYRGDGGPATSAPVNLAYNSGIAMDGLGNLYFADTNNQRVRMVTSAGIISTVAGNGGAGYSGDGGLAVSAQLNSPAGVAVDSAGNLYIADNKNNRVRRVSPDGIITTVAGAGSLGYSGDGGPAIVAQLSSPSGVAVDSAGKIYIADTNNNVVRLLTPQAPASKAPTLLAGGVVPVGSSVNTIQPGSWVSIYGTNLAESIITWNGTFTTSLGGTSVTINGKLAYLSYVSPTQINLQAPDDTATGSVAVVVTTPNGAATGTVTLAQVAPSFLLLDSKLVAGIILRQDGSGAYGSGSYDIVGPPGTFLGYGTVPAKAGDLVSVFATGLGPTNPAVAAGKPFTGAAPATSSVSLFLNNIAVTPLFVGLSSAGLFQINFIVPGGLGPGFLSLSVTVGGAQTQSGVLITLD